MEKKSFWAEIHETRKIGDVQCFLRKRQDAFVSQLGNEGGHLEKVNLREDKIKAVLACK